MKNLMVSRRLVLGGLATLAAPSVFVPRTASTNHLNVLFIGNSYTFTNELPDMLSAVAASDRIHPCVISVDSLTVGGARLDQLWKLGEGQEKLASKRWDYVVLQQHSLLTMTETGVDHTKRSIAVWNEKIHQAHSQLALYETWARKPGSQWYANSIAVDTGDGSITIRLVDADYMHQQIAGNTEQMAKFFGALEVPVGDRWAAAYKEIEASELYKSDGNHPSVAGTYLTALVFYHSLTGHSLEDVTFRPSAVSPPLARNLRKIAAGD